MQQRIIKANNYPLFICISLKELALFKLISDSCNIENCDQVFSQPCMYIHTCCRSTNTYLGLTRFGGHGIVTGHGLGLVVRDRPDEEIFGKYTDSAVYSNLASRNI